MGTISKLETRRASYDWKHQRAKVHAPVVCTAAMPVTDVSCKGCGYTGVCSCPRVVAAQQGRRIGKGMLTLGGLPEEWVTTTHKVEALPPGWAVSQWHHDLQQVCHNTCAYVELSQPGNKMHGRWFAHCVGGSTNFAPTRDEAMALALGWERCSDNSGWYPDKGRCGVVRNDDGTFTPWRVRVLGGDTTFAGPPSTLPHAIAWARNDDKPRCKSCGHDYSTPDGGCGACETPF